MNIGLDQASTQIEKVARAFLEGARHMKISVKTPPDSVGPLVVLRSHDPALVSRRLAERNILVSTRLDGIRFAFHVYNNLEDVEAALAVVEEHLDLMVRA